MADHEPLAEELELALDEALRLTELSETPGQTMPEVSIDLVMVMARVLDKLEQIAHDQQGRTTASTPSSLH